MFVEAQEMCLDNAEKVYIAPAATDVLDAPSDLFGVLMTASVCINMNYCLNEA